jgi:hypothetical protein
MLTYREKSRGGLECTVDLSALYPSRSELVQFQERYRKFRRCDKSTEALYRLRGGKLTYESEQVIPSKTNKKPPLLLIFGNPASHSVTAGCFFAYKDGSENRFWKNLLWEAGVMRFGSAHGLSEEEQNSTRTKEVLSLEYESPFRIGLCVYISMPSPAGGPWSGVAGIRKLIGSKPLKQLEAFETERILKLAERFLTNGGIAVTFQRNAWEGIRSDDDPTYSIGKAREASLRGSLKGTPKIPLLGVPPTRLIGPARDVLRQLLSREGYMLISETSQHRSCRGCKSKVKPQQEGRESEPLR